MCSPLAHPSRHFASQWHFLKLSHQAFPIFPHNQKTSHNPPKGECLPGMRLAHARRAIVLSILCLAPSLSPPREIPQVDCTRSQTFPARHVAPKYENSTTQNVTPTTSNHDPCHHHKLGAKDGPDSARGYSRLFGEGGHKQARVGNGQKKMPGALILPPSPPVSVGGGG